MEEIIRVENLTHTYGEGTPFCRSAVQDMSLAIYRGEFLGIIGHTGSGKSTLIQHLNGLLKPTSGRILLGGEDIWADPKKIRNVRFRVGLVFQYPEYQLFEETVYRDIAFGPTNMGLSKDEIDRRVRESAHFAGLTDDLLEKSPFALSGGQKRRVAIAGVIAMEPEVLVLDEPSAGLDPQGREELLSNIREFHRARGTTVVLVSHSMEEIAKNVDALLVINNERLREIYSDLSVMNAFGKADDTLTIAAKSIAEIITLPGIINLDFADVNTTMKDGGVALMSNGFGEGEGRVRQAVEDALNSPLLSNNDVKNAKKILFNVYFSEEAELRMEEMNDVHNFMSEFNRDIEVIWGTAVDNTLGNKVKMTILATGFTMDDIPLIADKRRTEAAQMTEEELRLEEERIEKERKERDLIGKYYGASAQKAGRFTSRAKAVVLTQEELDDDALIALIEDNPTYNRDPKIVARARSKVAGEDIQVSVPTTAKQPTNQPRQDSQRGGKQVISFR